MRMIGMGWNEWLLGCVGANGLVGMRRAGLGCVGANDWNGLESMASEMRRCEWLGWDASERMAWCGYVGMNGLAWMSLNGRSE